MLPLKDLNLGFTDAANYGRRQNKELFNRFFVQGAQLTKLLEPDRYFLIGEKGTGKTAFSVFLSNNNYKEHRSSITAIAETDYQAFIQLKRKQHLDLSDYDNIWRMILMVLLCNAITDDELDNNILARNQRLKALQKAIDSYHKNAFTPEVVTVLKFLNDSTGTAKVMAKVFQVEMGEKTKQTFEHHKYQTNIQYIKKQLIDALEKIKLRQSRILFIDGIDIRPHGVEYVEYLDCVRGLANACWFLNHSLFPTFRDSPGRLRVVLLIRPDIFAALGLQNQNAKIQDNAVYLNWTTTYPHYRSSEIFEIGDRMLAVQQKSKPPLGIAWDSYFPFKNNDDDSFISFLRFSFFRPRDIVKMMSLLRETAIQTRGRNADPIELDDFDNREFRRDYSNYLLGEVKDQLQFYYSDNDYEQFLAFFNFLDGRVRFTFDEFLAAFRNYQRSRARGVFPRENKAPPVFMENEKVFLQFLYELGVVCYREYQGPKTIYRWCFRERTYANMNPKIGTHAIDYEMHPGLLKALNAGTVRRRR